MLVRPESPIDRAGIRKVLLKAFDEHFEADLVDALRSAGRLEHSLVAVEDDRVVGHVALSAVHLNPPEEICISGVAPMAVLPTRQRNGIGSALMRAVIDAARVDGCQGVVLLGDPVWYGRFGFEPASARGLRCVYTDGPAFQAMPLCAGGLDGLDALVRYDPLFDELSA